MFKIIIRYLFFSVYRPYILIDLYNKRNNNNSWIISRVLSILSSKYFVDISKTAIVGNNIKLPHPNNIIVGAGTIIGNDCIIYHGVTLGQNRNEYPIIGNNVIIYTGAKVIGGVNIGDNAVIGANSVVTHDVPSNAIVGGIPAKILKMRTSEDEFY